MGAAAPVATPAPAGSAVPDSGVPSGTIAEVLAWVGDDPERAQAAYDAERAGQGRVTLLTALEDRGAS